VKDRTNQTARSRQPQDDTCDTGIHLQTYANRRPADHLPSGGGAWAASRGSARGCAGERAQRGVGRQVINGPGASDQHLGILGTSGIISVTNTEASPTAQELWPRLVDAVRQIPTQRFTRATHLVLNRLAWSWLLSRLDTTGRPLDEPQRGMVRGMNWW
jgi:hypothetical protein